MRRAWEKHVMRFHKILTALLAFSATFSARAVELDRSVIVSVPDQKIAVMENGMLIAQYPVSTSRYGLGDRFGSYATPIGKLEVAAKIGDGAPLGAVFKCRHFTGEILRPNATGRDPIVTRILWLRGLEARNSHAYERSIYIHGTPVERLIGRPASYGCIRMRSRDVVQLFNMVNVGVQIDVSNLSIHRALAQETAFLRSRLASN